MMDRNATPAERFRDPDPQYGPVPFWWWVGDPLDRERLAWQLDQLQAKGIRNAVVSYNHHADGSSNLGDPPIFSDAWWELFGWMVGQCRERGMRISFQDYTLLPPLLQEIGRETCGMQGGTLVETNRRITGPADCEVATPAGTRDWRACAWRVDDGQTADLIQIPVNVDGGSFLWNVPPGEWHICLIGVSPAVFDPLHPQAGALVIERFYAPFERNCLGELGKTIAISFQDELDFGSTMPRWNDRLLDEFQKRKGYDLAPLLPGLWHDVGPLTPKVRIDYHDVITCLIEESYFIPVFKWHEERGLLFGHDNCGRGGIRRGMEAYGDPFRTMRWYSAPGTDDPNLRGPRAFKGLKVNSSIAHLYERPRVWCECFHSSGWGTTPAEVIAALNADFVLGATVVNLHGLYYSTHGSWWEWAPPDFHFRQPYWEHSGALAGYITRLCETLSSGKHVCDVAMVYPVTALEAGLPAVTRPAAAGTRAFSEMQAGHNAAVDESEGHAFVLGECLMNAGIDFDFIDFESLERAELRDGQLHASGESYRVLLLPAMAAVRFSTMEKARDFHRAGGCVIAYGRLPIASERVGLHDGLLDAMVDEIFSAPGEACRGRLIHDNPAEVVEAIGGMITRDFIPRNGTLQCMHRRTREHDIYFVFNPGGEVCETSAFFRASGRANCWNPWTGGTQRLPVSAIVPEGTELNLRLHAQEANLIVFDRHTATMPAELTELEHRFESIPLADDWEFELKPTMDNRFGDFRLPPRDRMIGAEARTFRYAEESGEASGWHLPEWDDSAWPQVSYSFGPRFWRLGPLPPGLDQAELAAEFSARKTIDPAVPVRFDGREYFWQPYEFSKRWGVENDAFLKDWASGPHGLKGQVPDEFIDLHCDEPGSLWLLWTSVTSETVRPLSFVMGSRSRYTAWLGGRKLLASEDELPPGRQSIWNLPHYRSVSQQIEVTLAAGQTSMLLGFVQPAGQRVRAYAAFLTNDCPAAADDSAPALRWFREPDHPVFNHRPEQDIHAGWYRFIGPPGLHALRITARGHALRAWVDDREMQVNRTDQTCGDAMRYLASITDPSPGTSRVALRIEQAADSFGGDAIAEPIAMECVSGMAPLGDWSRLGLAHYSGTAWYRKIVRIDAQQASAIICGRCFLDLGGVRATAEVFWNGRSLGTLLTPPWRLEIPLPIHEGEHRLEILVANTLANHYHSGIPTPYVFEGQTVAGLTGPVFIFIETTDSQS